MDHLWITSRFAKILKKAFNSILGKKCIIMLINAFNDALTLIVSADPIS